MNETLTLNNRIATIFESTYHITGYTRAEICDKAECSKWANTKLREARAMTGYTMNRKLGFTCEEAAEIFSMSDNTLYKIFSDMNELNKQKCDIIYNRYTYLMSGKFVLEYNDRNPLSQHEVFRPFIA